MADVDMDQLSSTQQEALQQYIAVTDQDIKDAVPLLERSQWNVQVSLYISCHDFAAQIANLGQTPDRHRQVLRR